MWIRYLRNNAVCMCPHTRCYSTSVTLQILMNAEMQMAVVITPAQTPPGASPVPARVATLSVRTAYPVMVGHLVHVHTHDLSCSVPVPLAYGIHLKHVLGVFPVAGVS